jgi:peptidoglycan/xylan/chitin deacetylase (PgdA/CDA1 family)
MKTEVCITIDTEFNIGGAFADPLNRRPVALENVDCPAGGKDNGLPFLLATFKEYGISVTFFVEALNTCYFGDRPMGQVVERILRAGQDVQLHIHPCWLTFRSPDWQRDVMQTPPNDRCDGRQRDELRDMILQGIHSLERFGAPSPIAMRTGNLRADRTTYAAMAAAGLRLASNLGVALFRPADPGLQLPGGRYWIGEVLEVPVLSYSQLRLGDRAWPRLMSITASSWRETQSLLWQARRQQVPTIVVLTHPFEFIKGDRLDPAKTRINRINQARLRRLCAFIAEHPAEFAAVSFAQAGPGWLQNGAVPATELTVPLTAAMGRMVQNKANDLLSFV